MTRYLVGLDFGGTKGAIGVAAVGSDELAHSERFDVPPGADRDLVYTTAIQHARSLPVAATGEIAGIGVSFGGHVDVTRGVILRSLHVPGWDDFPIRDRLSAQFHAPVAIENDANAGALGEWRFGAGRGRRDMLYVTVSTGVGGGWILDDRLMRGCDGMAGEIGHMLVRPDGPVCSCGRRGCLEAVASGRAIARRAAEEAPGTWTAKQVAAEAVRGVAWAQRILSEAAGYLGAGLGNAICLMNPQVIVLGGGVTGAGEAYWETVRRAAAARALPGVTVDILPARHADDAPLYGALALAEQAMTQPPS
ncbi:MAG: ROK family protein [Thermomicrobiales bacterium]